MSDNNFFMTLPSNSSSTFFKDNMTTKFTTKLPRHMQLEGDWEVALVELHYPYSFWSVSERNCNIWYKERDNHELNMTRIASGNYTSEEDLVDAINRNDALQNKVQVICHVATRRSSVKILDESIEYIILNRVLALQLGFEPASMRRMFAESKELKGAESKGLKGTESAPTNPMNLRVGLPQQIFLYCDIIDHQIVGDVSAPLLRIVNIDSQMIVYGSTRVVEFNQPHYVSVLKRSFESIEIDMRTDTGLSIPFQFGTSIVKLHFRKK